MMKWNVIVAGGSVVSTRCSQTFQPRTAQLSLFGIPLWYSTNSPRVAIQVCVCVCACMRACNYALSTDSFTAYVVTAVLQYSCLPNVVHVIAWWVIVHGFQIISHIAVLEMLIVCLIIHLSLSVQNNMTKSRQDIVNSWKSLWGFLWKDCDVAAK